jgi:hypothetical protein
MDWDISVDTPEESSGRAHQPSKDGILDKIRQGMLYLSKRCSETLLSLYSQRQNSKPDSLFKIAASIHKDLYNWHELLPAELGWPRGDGNGPPAPGILIMQYVVAFPRHAQYISC